MSDNLNQILTRPLEVFLFIPLSKLTFSHFFLLVNFKSWEIEQNNVSKSVFHISRRRKLANEMNDVLTYSTLAAVELSCVYFFFFHQLISHRPSSWTCCSADVSNCLIWRSIQKRRKNVPLAHCFGVIPRCSTMASLLASVPWFPLGEPLFEDCC